MPALGTATNAPAQQRNNAPSGGGQPSAPAMLVPFVRATDENFQQANLDRVLPLTGSQVDLGITDIPAYGHLRWLWIIVEATGGTGTVAVAREDAPFNVLRDIALQEPSGAYITQFNDGFQAYLAQKYGGTLSPVASDPKANPFYSAVSTAGNFAFVLRIPVEVSMRDGVGALPNQDSAGQFKLRMRLGSLTDVYSTSPTTAPNVRIRAYMSAYDQPEMTAASATNQTSPPASGTTSFWTVQAGITVNAGENVIELKRKGNYLRQIIFVLRRGGTSRANAQTDYPAELRFLRDAFPARYYADPIWRTVMWERTGFDGALEAKNGLDNGVRFHDYMSEFTGLLGAENRDRWQPTRGSTRLEIAGNFANAGTLDIITNDVAVANNVWL